MVFMKLLMKDGDWNYHWSYSSTSYYWNRVLKLMLFELLFFNLLLLEQSFKLDVVGVATIRIVFLKLLLFELIRFLFED